MPHDPTRCPRCGAPRAAHAAAGLCPACLLAAGLAHDEGPAPYRILTPIGSDTEAVTYLAETTSGVGHYVALKIVGPCSDANLLLQRYDRWRSALSDIRHAAVRRILDAGLAGDDQVYLAHEYVTGSSLAAAAVHRALTAAQRVAIARQVVQGVAAAHACGVVHSRLDASHVKVATSGYLSVKILGFGTSLIVDGREDRPDADVLALAQLVRELEIDLPAREYATAADMEAVLA